MLDKMKERCRICGQELYGNQRRWIFHTASKLNLQVVLTHVLGKEISRKGKAEFSCSKCAFVLERIYRFDTVIARIEALSIERLQKLISEKDRLKHCLANLYRRNNSEEDGLQNTGCEGIVDISNLPDARYSALLQDNFVFSGFECWNELEEQNNELQHCQHTECIGTRPRRCRGCSTLRVADFDYEAVCKVPRKVARSTSCGPSTRCSASMCNEEVTVIQLSPGDVAYSKASIDVEFMEKMSPGSSFESLPNTLETGPQTQKQEVTKATSDSRKCDCSSNMAVYSSSCGNKLDAALNLVRTFNYRPVKIPKGSRIPVKSCLTSLKLKSTLSSKHSNIPASGLLSIAETRQKVAEDIIFNFSDLHMWQDIYDDYLPLRTKSLVEKQYKDGSIYETMSKQHIFGKEAIELQLQTLQKKLLDTEASNKMLRENLNQVTSDLNAAQELSHKQQNIIQTLKETVQDRDNEVAELYHIVEELSNTVAKLQGMQTENLQASHGTSSQLQLVDLQNTLFCTQSELQKLKQTLRQKEQQLTNAKRSQLLLEADLVEGQQQKETTWKHNQELHEALHRLLGELHEKTLQLRNTEEEKCTTLQAQEHTIQHLNQTLSQNRQLIQDYMDLLEYQQSLYNYTGGNEHLVEKLHQRIKDRDAALERAIDDKFCALEEKEKEMQQLKIFGRGKERDLEQLRSVVSANEETISSLDNLVRAKDMELEQIASACKNLQWLLQETEQKNSHFLNERDAIVQQLQSALEERRKEVEGMTACLLRSPAFGSEEMIEELKVCMEMKEKLLQNALHASSQQADEHKREIQELLDTIASEKMDQTIICGNCKLKEQHHIKRNLPLEPSRQFGVLSGDLTSTHKSGDLKEAENEKTETPAKDNLAKATEDLQFFFKKEEGNQYELSALKSVIKKQSEQLQEQSADIDALTRSMQMKEDLIKDLQVQLVDPEEMPTVERLTQEVLTLKEKLASVETNSQECSEYCSQKLIKILEEFAQDKSRLKQALETEKQLYSNLIQFHEVPNSFNNSSALQAELQTAQALRTQLEDTLERAVERLAQLDSKNRVSTISYGGLIGDTSEEGFSSHLTNSIEDETDASSIFSCTEGTVPSSKRGEDKAAAAKVRREFCQEAKEKSNTQELFILKIKQEDGGVHSAVDIRTILDDVCLIKDTLKVKSESAVLGQSEDEKMEDDGWPVEEDVKQEIRRISRSQTKAETVIKHLKALALNYRDREGGFNPDLIVNMAKEIEHLKMEKTSAKSNLSLLVQITENETSKGHCSREQLVGAGDFTNPITNHDPQSILVSETQLITECPVTQGYLKKQTLQLQSELVNTMRQKQELQERLVVSEATVHAQTDQLKQYRILFNEPLIEQDNKQVQVDLQDLGYETCGRSEYEDRDEATSPEYEEQGGIFSEASLMEELTSSYKGCPALVANSPLNNSCCLQNDWTVDWEKSEDVIVLQQHVKDLKAQLQKSQKLIRSLQCQACSFSALCNSAASQNHLKHSFSFHGSTSHSITDEDEGWQSDKFGTYSTKDLEQLVKRVSVLEAQLCHSINGGVQGQIKSAIWPGKYDSLIQAQARELSLLRQKLKEGRSVGHILCQHLGDTVKSFEELLRANDIDYYMGQGFREQLAHGSQLADRLNSKLNSKEHLEVDDKSRHELLAIRLSKELQQKNKIIESLQSKLEDRSVTPSSTHAISESDQSDRTSFASDDQLSTNEDIEACSEVATASKCNQCVCGSNQTTDAIRDDYVVPLPSKSSLSTSLGIQPQHHLNTPSHHVDTEKSLQGLCFNHIPSSVNELPTNESTSTRFQLSGAYPPVHGPEVFSLADVQQELHTLQKQLTERTALISAACVSSNYFDANTSSTFPYFPHTLHRSPQTTEQQAAPECSSALWDVSDLLKPINTDANGDASSGSSGYQTSSKPAGSDVLEEHLIEIRNLCHHLEKSIYNNDLLREQLKEILTAKLPQLSNENRTLREENISLQIQINHITQEYDVELKKLQNQVNISRSQLMDLETELEKKKLESKTFQGELEEKELEVLHLKKEQLLDRETNNRLQHQATLLQQQLNENHQLNNILHSELQWYKQLYGSSKLVLSAFSSDTFHSFRVNNDFSELLSEVRSLRYKMEQSIEINNSIRLHLDRQLEGNTASQIHSLSGFTPSEHRIKEHILQGFNQSSMQEMAQQLERDATDGSFANKNGCHVIGHIDDFRALNQQILEGEILMKNIKTLMQSSLNIPFLEVHGPKALDYESIKKLFSATNTLQQILEESKLLLGMFWRADLPSMPSIIEEKKEETLMKDEISQLKVKLKEQEIKLQETMDHLKITNRANESMEQFIVSQLTRTHDMLKKAKSNLQVKCHNSFQRLITI